MIEIPEAITIAKQLKNEICGATVQRIISPSKLHKFCWFNGNPSDYDSAVKGSIIADAKPIGIFVELTFKNGMKLCFNDGVNVRLIRNGDAPKQYQLLIETNYGILVFTVAMYGGIVLHDGTYDNDYYVKSKDAVMPFSEKFEQYYRETFANSKPTLSAKAFLATAQRFPGIGNGVLQDILFAAHINPKRRINTLSQAEINSLLDSVVSVLNEMTEAGGRDTEKDIFGSCGGYKTRMSKMTFAGGCPCCGSPIIKETYLGGSVYYCPVCQPL